MSKEIHRVDIPLPLDRGASRWLRRGLLGALLGGLVVIVTLAGVWVDRPDPGAWQEAAPAEGYLWSVAQYEIAFLRMRAELTAEAAGQPVDRPLHDAKAGALDRQSGSLLRAAQTPQAYGDVPAFLDAARKIASFQRKVMPLLSKASFTREDAIAVLVEFDLMGPTLATLERQVLDEQTQRVAEMNRAVHARQQLLGKVKLALWSVMAALVVGLAWFLARERKASKDRLRAARALSDLAADKELFLSKVSHELRSPLQAVINSLDALERKSADMEQVELVDKVRAGAERLSTQLGDLMTLASGHEGTLEIQPVTFEARDLVIDVAEEQREQAERKGLCFDIRTPPEPMFVVADPKRVAQALTNLISNAIKYTAQGTVEVELKPYDEAEGLLCLRVSDTGQGIPKDALSQIFKPYHRFGKLDRSTQGTGIGLAIVKTIVDHLGGRITVESVEGAGSTFSLDIAAAAVVEQPEDEGAKRVLIVDDREDLLEGFAQAAVDLGYAVDTASVPAQAANLLASRPYDVVLIDLDMPVKPGKELASDTRRSSGPNKGAWLVAMSAASGRAVGSAWPFNEFLQKPFDRRRLRGTLEAGLAAAARTRRTAPQPANGRVMRLVVGARTPS